MKSIISRAEECYFCHTTEGLQTHHCLFGSYRKLADKYGLTVKLCFRCHGELHAHGIGKEELQKLAQSTFEKEHSREEFMKIFGRNYL